MRTKVLFLCRLFTAAFLMTGSAFFVLGAATAAADDDTPDVTVRVARISFLRGDVQVKRLDADEWEVATLNLPMVEGDEVATSAGSRVEIQFDNNQHLRLDENAYLRIAVLKDEGIAVSISLGSMNLRITKFDKADAFFEIDAPRSTIAVQKAGQYRIDAGQEGESEIRVAVTQGGEARVYSENSGFTVKSNRSARVFITGDNAGEWEPADAMAFSDDFDTWSLDRDTLIAQRLQDAHYGKYYDQDIYGADDLNGYGEWVYVSQYGYVWRPYTAAISSYANWSPYRYGAWRWVQPFGWTWVNDEPWGWATYHHGRWVYNAGSWYWSPYGFQHSGRSWWFPALVSFNVYNNNICWYPLGYHQHWHNYNNHHGGTHPPIVPTPQPTPIGPPIRQPGKIPPKIINAGLSDEIPAGGVIQIGSEDFGKVIKVTRTVPPNIANSIIATSADGPAPVLPDHTKVIKNAGPELVVSRPRTDRAAANTKVGAAPRKTAAPLDNQLRIDRIQGGRPPVTAPAGDGSGGGDPSGIRDTRNTGAVDRPPVRQPPVIRPPVTIDPPRQPPVKVAPPRIDPPVRQPPRVDPAPVRQPPRTAPPVRQPPPKSDPPSKAPPTKTGAASGSGNKKVSAD